MRNRNTKGIMTMMQLRPRVFMCVSFLPLTIECNPVGIGPILKFYFDVRAEF